MKAKLQGFYWSKSEGVSLDEIASALKKIAHEEHTFGDYKRLVYIDKADGYHMGVFLTSKDQRKAPTVEQSGGRMVVRVLELGNPIVDFNFFVISDKTRRGLYQHYHHSAGIGQFTGFCKEFHDEIRNKKRDELIRTAGSNASQKRVREIRRPYRHTLKHGYLMRSEDLKALLQRMDRIRDFSFEYMEVKPSNHHFSPLQSVSKKKVHRFVFSKGPKNAIITAITDAVNGLKLSKGVIHASRSDNEPETIKILENPSHFGEFEVDDITTDETLDVSNIQSSWFLKKMLRIAKKTPQIAVQ